MSGLSDDDDNIASCGGYSSGPTPKKKKTSIVWESFTVSESDPSKAICNICKSKISRGKDPKHIY